MTCSQNALRSLKPGISGANRFLSPDVPGFWPSKGLVDISFTWKAIREGIVDGSGSWSEKYVLLQWSLNITHIIRSRSRGFPLLPVKRNFRGTDKNAIRHHTRSCTQQLYNIFKGDCDWRNANPAHHVGGHQETAPEPCQWEPLAYWGASRFVQIGTRLYDQNSMTFVPIGFRDSLPMSRVPPMGGHFCLGLSRTTTGIFSDVFASKGDTNQALRWSET